MSGHTLLIKHLKKDPSIEGKNVIEIGTTREINPRQDSSKHLFLLSQEKNFNFITVDMDPENTERIKSRFPGINAITMKGEDFLKNYEGNIDYIYLDAFDFYHGGHTEKRQQAYKTHLNTSINDTECHQMHLECVQNCYQKVNIGGIIVFDDVLGSNFNRGKGVTAIPFLLENGFELLEVGSSFASFKKIK